MEWIKCSDRLPDVDTDVLTWNDKWQHQEVGHLWVNSYDKYHLHENGLYRKEIVKWEPMWTTQALPTHWMPLPKPPEVPNT